jgi:hypothetical protein
VKDDRDYPNILRGLFPGHPARRLLCTSMEPDESGSIRKRVRTIGRGAHLTDYSKHLETKSYDGPGALGVIPTVPEAIGARSRWFARFLALDFDTVALTDVGPLVAVLEEHRVYTYLDQGTTGRGVHLYVFLSDPLPQWEAHEALTTMPNLSERRKLPHPKHMPSSSSEPGRGILLPYRGAAGNGFGANPLIDPLGGEQIPLGETESELVRTDVEDLRVLVENLSGAENAGNQSVGSRNRTYNPIDISTYSGGLKAWDAEVTRLRKAWAESRRQHLALGATAYGISLGIGAGRVKGDIEALEKASSDPEVDERLKAVDGTIERRTKGRRIAWRKFYTLADVEPPGANRVVPWEVILRLQILEDRLRSAPFNSVNCVAHPFPACLYLQAALPLGMVSVYLVAQCGNAVLPEEDGAFELVHLLLAGLDLEADAR